MKDWDHAEWKESEKARKKEVALKSRAKKKNPPAAPEGGNRKSARTDRSGLFGWYGPNK